MMDRAGEALILADLTDEQRAAVSHGEGPLIVVAGPGSGKTRVITRRVAWLIATGAAPPWQILAITFTNKAAEEMRRRIDDLVGAGTGVLVSTFHSFCARTLRRYGPPGRTESFAIYDEDDQRACVKRVVEELRLDEKVFRPADLLAKISQAKNRMLSAEDYASGALGFRDDTIARVFGKYEEALARFNALDFDDLLLSMVRLLETRQDVRDALRSRYRYILVDEYQDTNLPQARIANLLAGENGNICVVGDPDQSIYRFRGAEILNILDFERAHPAAREVRLERNYRSTKRILAAAQRLIEHNIARRAKTLYTENDEGDPIRVVRCLSDDEEARWVARAVEESIERGTPPGEIAIFYRVAALSRKFEEELRRRAVRHQVVGAVPFFQRKEVKDVLAWLRVLANPADEQQVRRLAALTEGLGPATLRRVEELAAERGLALLEAMRAVGERGDVRPQERRAVERVVQLLDALAERAREGVGPMLRAIIEETGIERALRSSENPQERARAENVRALVDAGYEFDERRARGGAQGDAGGAGDFREFLDHVALLSPADQAEDEFATVKLMTLHAAKGLEFDDVFIVGADAGFLPLEREGEAPDVEEERRLLYVGLTRARRRVTLTTARVRRTYGQDRSCAPSPFLAEIPREAIEQRGAGGDDLDGAYEPLPSFDVPFARGAESFAPARRNGRAERRPPDFAPAVVRAAAARPSDLVPGDRVEHAVFGKGQVVDITGTGIGTRVKVEFDAVGIKTLVLQYANLQRI